ncbi:hypothetical protein [Microbulbifer variabilis]|uniref:hypothetical protein n=1 Tax=Microbulbifer variabilis TaxID=266805 RepID=UPI0003629972|nr:hypothetical protein [Microbulbifer variabilis]
MRLIKSCVAGLLLLNSLVLKAEPYLYKNITLDVPGGWSRYEDPYNKIGIQFRQKGTGNLMAYILREGLLKDGGDPDVFLEQHPLEHPVSSVQIGNYSGYFVTFKSKGKCMANWFLGDGIDLLVAHFQSDCNSVDFSPVIEVVESITMKVHTVE